MKDFVKLKRRLWNSNEESVIRFLVVSVDDIASVYEDFEGQTFLRFKDAVERVELAETSEDVYCKILESREDR